MYPMIHSNRMNKLYRGHHRKGTIPNHLNVKSLYTPPDRFLNRAPHIEMKEVPISLKTGSEWDRLSGQVWDKFVTCQQKQGTYIKKINTWKNLYDTLMVFAFI